MATSVFNLLQQRLREQPDAVAIVSGDAVWTRSDVARASRVIANKLRAYLRPGDVAALAADRSPELVAIVLAVWSLGAQYAPIDLALPRQRQMDILNSVAPTLLIAANGFVVDFDGPQLRVQDLMHSPDDGTGSTDFAEPSPDLPRYIMCTSGSTGLPNPVVVTDGALSNVLQHMIEEVRLNDTDRLLAVTNSSFDISLFEFFAPLLTGAQLHICAAEDASDAARLARALENSKASIMQATPSTWDMLASSGRGHVLPHRRLCGGEPLRAPLAAIFAEVGGETWNCYGPTETTIWSTMHKLPPECGGQVPIGRPIIATDIYVLNERLEPVADGEAGDLFIAGAGLSLGYWRRPAATARAFLPDPFSSRPGARMYKTGDRVRVRSGDGALEFVGRVDGQVKLRGHRIELGDIETALARQPGVNEGVAVLLDGDAISAMIAAVWTAEPNSATKSDVILLGLREQLPAAAVPSRLFALPSLPRTPNGKIDRQKVAAWLNDQVHAALPQRLPAAGESELAAIWSELLSRPIQSTQANFFMEGGNSIAAARLIALVEDRLGATLLLKDIFARPTLAEMAADLRTAPRTARRETSQDLRMSHIQEILVLRAITSPDGLQDLVCELITLKGAIDAPRIRLAMDAAVSEHDILWTQCNANGPFFDLIDNRAPIWTEHDLRHLPEDQRLAQAVSLHQAAIAMRFDIYKGPLFRLMAIRIADDEILLSLIFHHLVVDNTSISVILKKFETFHRDPGRAPRRTRAFFDYVAWQRETFTEERAEPSTLYWRERLSRSHDVRLANARSPFDETDAFIERRLPAHGAEIVNRFAEANGATPFLVGLATLVWSLTAQRQKLGLTRVDFFMFDRFGPGLPAIVGPLLSGMCVLVETDETATLLQTLEKVRTDFQGALAHKDMPFPWFAAQLMTESGVTFNWIYKAPLDMAPHFEARYAPQDNLLEALPGNLHLEIIASESGLNARFFYNSVNIDRDVVEQVAALWAGSIDSIEALLP